MHLSDLPPRRDKRPRIELRRFAGTDAHREQLSHLRIAHLTDLHFGRMTPLAVQQRAVAIVNDEGADLVVITGDFVCHSQMYLDQLVEVLKTIRAPTIGVLGNHDYWSGAEEVALALRRADVELLRNQNTSLELKHQRIQIVGLDDAYTGHADRAKAVKGLRKDVATIGLSHIAEEADWLWAHHVPLVLAGHTHAGQVTLARLHELALGKLVGHKYVHGLYGTRAIGGAPRSADGTGPHSLRGNGDGRRSTHPPTRASMPPRSSVPPRASLPPPRASVPPRSSHPPGHPSKGAVYVSAGIGAAVMPLRIGERGRREVAMFELGHEVRPFTEHHREQPALEGRKPSEELTAKRQAFVHKRMLQREIADAKRMLREERKR